MQTKNIINLIGKTTKNYQNDYSGTTEKIFITLYSHHIL